MDCARVKFAGSLEPCEVFQGNQTYNAARAMSSLPVARGEITHVIFDLDGLLLGKVGSYTGVKICLSLECTVIFDER